MGCCHYRFANQKFFNRRSTIKGGTRTAINLGRMHHGLIASANYLKTLYRKLGNDQRKDPGKLETLRYQMRINRGLQNRVGGGSVCVGGGVFPDF